MSDAIPVPEPSPRAPPSGPTPARGGWRRRAAWVLGALAVVALVALVVAWRVERIANDPAFCDSCHLDAMTAHRQSAHRQQRCVDCHENRFRDNVRQWAHGLYSRTRAVPHGKPDASACKRCHTSGNVEAWQMARSLGHAQHVLKAEPPVDCAQCHLWKKHQTEPDPDACARCHDDIEVHGEHAMEGRSAKISCVSCHNYLARVAGGAHTPSHDCRRCHGGVEPSEPRQRHAQVVEAKSVPPSRVHGNLKACSLCHDPHQKDPAGRARGMECHRCHARIDEEYHQRRQPRQFQCASCHQPHGERKDLKTGCHRCHEAQAKATRSVASKHDRCTQCHEPHEFTATFAGCRTCHEDQATLLAGWKSETHAQCRNCHEPHGQRTEGATCAGCHDRSGHQHTSCTTCHDPHRSRTETRACGSCHQPELTAAGRGPARHRDAACQTCHRPHAMAGASGACKACHAKQTQAVVAARVDAHTRCSSCHATHAFSTDLAACASCHQVPTEGAHTGKCTDCHQGHGPPLGKAAACKSCHPQVAEPAGKHARCDTCHEQAHGAVKSKPCAACHTTQEAAMRLWRPGTHQGCAQCHATHAPTTPKRCGACHTVAEPKVQKSGHRCTTCHDAHQQPQPPGDGCARCHATETRAAAGRGPRHSACRTCHDPHDVEPPTCASCHATLPGAHTARGHDRCASCHDTHRKRFPARSDCLTCHASRQNHHPEAQHCYGCHLFNSK